MRASMGALRKMKKTLADERRPPSRPAARRTGASSVRDRAGGPSLRATLADPGPAVIWASRASPPPRAAPASRASLPGSMWLAITSCSLACRRSPWRSAPRRGARTGAPTGSGRSPRAKPRPGAAAEGGRESGENVMRGGRAPLAAGELLVVLRAQAVSNSTDVRLGAALEDGATGRARSVGGRVDVAGRGGTCRRRRGRRRGSRRRRRRGSRPKSS